MSNPNLQRKCNTCKKVKSFSAFRMRHRFNDHLLILGRRCNECKLDRWQMRKKRIMQEYGKGKCVCCGEKHIEFLTIDHIGGKKTRIELGHNGELGALLYKTLERNSYPHKNKLRVLCCNCNQAIIRGRVCPHKRKYNNVKCNESKKS